MTDGRSKSDINVFARLIVYVKISCVNICVCICLVLEV